MDRFIGFGHLKKSLAKGLVKNGVEEEKDIYVKMVNVKKTIGFNNYELEVEHNHMWYIRNYHKSIRSSVR